MSIPEFDVPHSERSWRGGFLTHAIAVCTVTVWGWNGDRIGQRPLRARLSSHVALILIMGALVGLGSLRWLTTPRGVASEAAVGDEVLAPMVGGQQVTAALATGGARAYHRDLSQNSIARRANPHTAIPNRPRLEIITYVVQPGDTAESIAAYFGLQPTTILWSNPALEKAPDLLKVGQELTILPLDGVYHTVEAGDTLESIAEEYEASVADIVNCSFNTLPPGRSLLEGMKLIVPGGTKPYELREVTTYVGPVPDDVVGSGLFYWPASGSISQGYWYGHRAVDIANAIGAAIVASDSGYVSFAGWTDIGYGYLIVVDHANGYQTYYAHLDNIYVVEGQAVDPGQVIGAMGSTGNSTGPHLHFEVRYGGYPTNPLVYLP
ncbi:MAG: LysM peptidoglycan-binding domain-containing M23 family metallopeptidase [Anaerolineae bacterium]|jgi:murein DD-endopeptidase MepM/ murein hydrolase activator NlpD|nr:LysM peptidoglycan-binding domain-containing M23 family metallopeptidase [Anaerolineae bacterium]